MKTATLDQTIADLDFAPACSLAECPHGNPTATHTLTLSLSCDTLTWLICGGCAADMLRSATTPGLVVACYRHGVQAPVRDAVRIEPLP